MQVQLRSRDESNEKKGAKRSRTIWIFLTKRIHLQKNDKKSEIELRIHVWKDRMDALSILMTFDMCPGPVPKDPVTL